VSQTQQQFREMVRLQYVAIIISLKSFVILFFIVGKLIFNHLVLH